MIRSNSDFRFSPPNRTPARHGLISRPKDEEFEVVYRERRLQPFWRLSTHTRYSYERTDSTDPTADEDANVIGVRIRLQH